METIEWTEDLGVGNQQIDEDHRHLFSLLNQLHQIMKVGLVTQDARQIIDDLAEYTASHFAREEGFMQRIGYPDYPTHKSEHDRFVSEVHSLQSRLDRGAHTLTLSVDTLLTDWLRRHVLVMDKALAASLKASAH